MSRYLLLFLLNAPFIFAGILNTLVNYKLSRFSRTRFVVQMSFWIVILAGLASAQLIYDYLSSRGLTQTDPLSLFDVVQITAIVMVYYIASRTRSKLDAVEKRLRDLHQEVSIILSEKK
jgi:hypothetical protein